MLPRLFQARLQRLYGQYREWQQTATYLYRLLRELMSALLVKMESLLYNGSRCVVVVPWRQAMKPARLGNRLKVARAVRNLSQEELASLVGVTRQTISAIETGRYGPSALLALLLSRHLDTPVDELFFIGDDEQ